MQLEYSPGLDSDENPHDSFDKEITSENHGSQALHTLMTELIKKGNLQELYRLMRDQKKLIKINNVQNGLALIHHAALKSDPRIFQLILNFKGVDLSLKSAKGLKASEMTSNS